MADLMQTKVLSLNEWWLLASPNEEFVARPTLESPDYYMTVTSTNATPTESAINGGMSIFEKEGLSSDMGILNNKYVWVRGNATLKYIKG